MVDLVPEGECGDAKITHLSLSQERADLDNRIFAFDHLKMLGDRWQEANLIPGTYCKLTIGGELFMTDGPIEEATNRNFVEAAKGDVLIAGLGIGMVLPVLFDRRAVRSVTVIEKLSEVIELVGPHYASYKRLAIEQGDAYRWQPTDGRRFDTIWLDIWPDINTDHIRPQIVMRRRYSEFLKPGGWIGVWGHNEAIGVMRFNRELRRANKLAAALSIGRHHGLEGEALRHFANETARKHIRSYQLDKVPAGHRIIGKLDL